MNEKIKNELDKLNLELLPEEIEKTNRENCRIVKSSHSYFEFRHIFGPYWEITMAATSYFSGCNCTCWQSWTREDLHPFKDNGVEVVHKRECQFLVIARKKKVFVGVK